MGEVERAGRAVLSWGGAMRVDGELFFVLVDQLGSASVTLDADGEVAGEMRYYPFGEVRTASGSLWTDQLFTGQRAMLDLGIYHYNARFYSPYLKRFLSADTVVPGAAQSQAYDRYAYSYGNPVRYIDPDGHWPQDPPTIPSVYPLLQQAIEFFSHQGWEVLGDPTSKSIYTNGADVVFIRIKEVLAVELKDVARNVNLGTLGKNKLGEYGGSIAQVVRSARRFFDSNAAQLKMESDAIIKAFENGNLKNALFTSANDVSQKAREQFNGVYNRLSDGTVNTMKAIPAVVSAVKATIQQAASIFGSTEMFFPFFMVIDPKNPLPGTSPPIFVQ